MNPQKKYKVAFIHPDLGIGGAERLVLDVAVALSSKLHDVLFVTNHFHKVHAFEELSDDKYPIHVIGDWIPRSVCGVCQAVCAYLRMFYLIVVYLFFTSKEDKPDVYFVDQIPMAVPFIKWAGNKVIYYCHHPDLLASPPGGVLKRIYRLPINWLEFQCTAYADVLLVNSKYTESVFRDTFPNITKDIKILYPTISSSYQNKVENAKQKNITEVLPEIKLSSDSVIFLSINRFHPAKKLELALNGMEALKQKLSSDDWDRVHLIIAGGYDPQMSINATYFTKLIRIAQAKGIITKVTFLKSPSDDLKADLLLACDCLIYTPVNEHFGIVPLEAMIASKPVIACNSGGPCETVKHEVTGFLCDSTPESLAHFMDKMLNKNNAKIMGQLGKIRQQRYFSHDRFTSTINTVIEDIKIHRYRKGEIDMPGQDMVSKAQSVTNEVMAGHEINVNFEKPRKILVASSSKHSSNQNPVETGNPVGVNDTAEVKIESPVPETSANHPASTFKTEDDTTVEKEDLFVNSSSTSISGYISPISNKNILSGSLENNVN